MAKQAGVPFLFVSAPAFQSMWFGMTNVKIRSFFRALRKAAQREGGAIGFIEEIDAIGSDRAGLAMSPELLRGRRSCPPVHQRRQRHVNELLIQMQSFDQPGPFQRTDARTGGGVAERLPAGAAAIQGRARPVITTSWSSRPPTGRRRWTPRCCAPGRFDRRLYFDPPTKKGRSAS